LLLGSLFFASLGGSATNDSGESCIRCHISTYEAGMDNLDVHPPFRDGQCVVCHLADNAAAVAGEDETSEEVVTGSIVDQGELWRKSRFFSTEAGLALDHRVGLPIEDPNAAYRFRIVVSSSPFEARGDSYASLWMGLQPGSNEDFDRAGQLDLDAGLAAPLGQFVDTALLFRAGGGYEVFWETYQPLYGRVELQEIEGMAAGDPSSSTNGETTLAEADEEQHPELRTPEELAIDACYECHPKSTLGTSHPVRLYGGRDRDVRIPEELPTVDGMLTCVTCHEPHGAEGKKLIRETVKTKLCVACHYKFKNTSPSTMFD
ncbi:MAG: cytochrome c3 family protein, partial [Desulfuromonadales bacterium]